MNAKKSFTILTALLGLVLTTGAAGAKPNITTAKGGVFIWGSNPANKKWVPWGTIVTLKAADSIFPNQGNGRCAFNVLYTEKETNNVNAGAFTNKLYSDADVRAINGTALHANEVKSLQTQPYLDPGAHKLRIFLDKNGNVDESSEGDNYFAIGYQLLGSCP